MRPSSHPEEQVQVTGVQGHALAAPIDENGPCGWRALAARWRDSDWESMQIQEIRTGKWDERRPTNRVSVLFRPGVKSSVVAARLGARDTPISELSEQRKFVFADVAAAMEGDRQLLCDPNVYSAVIDELVE